jgi:hypothetical protein
MATAPVTLSGILASLNAAAAGMGSQVHLQSSRGGDYYTKCVAAANAAAL